MKFDIELEFNGRKIRPDELSKVVGNSMKQQAIESVRQSAQKVVCPVHGKRPRPEGTDGFVFCCEELRDLTGC